MGMVTGVTCGDEFVVIEGWRAAQLPGHGLDRVERERRGNVARRGVDCGDRARQEAKRPLPCGSCVGSKQSAGPMEAVPAMYLIMPDRFSNGTPDNDDVDSAKERGVDRTEMYARHGGDLQGVTDRLGYLEDLGHRSHLDDASRGK